MAIAPTRRVSGTSEPRKQAKPVYATGGDSDDFVEAIDPSTHIGVQSNPEYDREKKKKQQEDTRRQHEVLTSSVYVKSAIEALAASGVYDTPEEGNIAAKKNVTLYSHNQSMVSKEERPAKGKPDDDEFNAYFSEFEEEETSVEVLIEEIDKLI